MPRILTGIQSSGKPHLGNLLGAILPAIQLSKESNNNSLFFIADMHSLTTIKDAETLKENTYSVAAAWLACGLDTDKCIFYRQSDVAIVTELAWILNCSTPYPMLANAHSFKDKASRLSDVNAGLFTYPVLMAADILLYDAEIVPVGKDQIQHLEMTRDIAIAFNNTYGETLTLPKAQINEELMLIPGTDGQKMSKSRDNYIDIFLPEKLLKKAIATIQTDSTPLEAPKNWANCNVFKLYSLMCNQEQLNTMKTHYEQGNFGYGHAKQALLELILERFKSERIHYEKIAQDYNYLDQQLLNGANKAKEIANKVLDRVRRKIGY
ncbi:MAG: tryptophan--tRNA ligase [Cytophagales bacterium]|nr:MAG: tryptophan--tRNA ligase [Cytophagales bacterium]